MLRTIAVLCLLAGASFAQNPATAVFPGVVATDTTLAVMCNSSRSIMATALTNSIGALTFNVADGSRFCAPSYITIDSEIVKACSKSTNTITICAGGRGWHNTTVANHILGAAVVGYIDADLFNNSFAEVKAIQTALGAALVNVLTPGRNLAFSSDSAYDIGSGGGGRPRDIFMGRNLNMASGGVATLGDIQIQASISTFASTTLTLSTANNGQLRRMTAATDVTITVAPSLGLFSTTLVQAGAGRLIFVAGAGVTLSNPHAFTRTAGVGAVVTVLCTAANSCILAGDLEL